MTPQKTGQATRPRNGPLIRKYKRIGLCEQPIDTRKGELEGGQTLWPSSYDFLTLLQHNRLFAQSIQSVSRARDRPAALNPLSTRN